MGSLEEPRGASGKGVCAKSSCAPWASHQGPFRACRGRRRVVLLCDPSCPRDSGCLLSPRTFAKVLELSAKASQEAALVNQEALERAEGLDAPSRWYFGEGAARGEPPGGLPEATAPAGAL